MPKISDKSSSDYDNENQNDYIFGGYHPVAAGDIYNDKYLITKKLGWGTFSTVWKAKNLCAKERSPDKFVALKFHKSYKSFQEAALKEIGNCKTVKKRLSGKGGNIVQLIEFFDVEGPNGTHVCCVFSLMERSLLQFIVMTEKSAKKRLNTQEIKFPVIPLKQIKGFTRDILKALHFLHSECKLIHSDLKPENIVLSLSNQNKSKTSTAFITDLGNAVEIANTSQHKNSARQYRAPEAILGQPLCEKIDIWALGCIVFEMITGEFLFIPKEDRLFRFNRDDDHLAKMIELLGPMPPAFTKRGKRANSFFSPRGPLRRVPDLDCWALEDVLHEQYGIDSRTAPKIARFLRGLLEFDPQKRLSALQALSHCWLSQ